MPTKDGDMKPTSSVNKRAADRGKDRRSAEGKDL
jgi:hypothetical protein